MRSTSILIFDERGSVRRREFIAAAGGTILAWPGRAASQAQKSKPRIAVLWHAATAEEEHPYFGELIKGFRELGYAEGRTHSRAPISGREARTLHEYGG